MGGRAAGAGPGRLSQTRFTVSGSGPVRSPPVQRGDRGHRRVVELEVEQREVLLDPAAGDRLREDDVAALEVPAQRHLRRACGPSRSAIVGDHRVVERPCRGAIGDHASVTIPCSASNARTSSCARYGCTSIWLTAGTVPRSPRTAAQVVRAGSSRRRSPAPGRRRRSPPAPATVARSRRLRRQRPVDEEQVERGRSRARPASRRTSAGCRRGRAAVVQLAGDEHLVAGEPGLRGPPGRRPPRCRTSARCRCAGSRPPARCAWRRRSPPAGSGRRRSPAAGSRRRCSGGRWARWARLRGSLRGPGLHLTASPTAARPEHRGGPRHLPVPSGGPHARPRGTPPGSPYARRIPPRTGSAVRAAALDRRRQT